MELHTHRSTRLTRIGLMLIASSVLLTGCAGFDGNRSKGENEQKVNPQPSILRTPPDSSDLRDSGQLKPNPAAIQLRERAAEAAALGDYQTASSLLERALRIEPRNASNYYALAEIRMQQARPGEAIEITQKALSLPADAALRESLKALQVKATRSMNANS